MITRETACRTSKLGTTTVPRRAAARPVPVSVAPPGIRPHMQPRYPEKRPQPRAWSGGLIAAASTAAQNNLRANFRRSQPYHGARQQPTTASMRPLARWTSASIRAWTASRSSLVIRPRPTLDRFLTTEGAIWPTRATPVIPAESRSIATCWVCSRFRHLVPLHQAHHLDRG